MIYLVTKSRDKIPDWMQVIDIPKSLELMKQWPYVQFDTETSGLDPHIDHLISLQFGYVNDKTGEDTQVVVDCTACDPILYKGFLESRPLIGQNLKFDLEFLYSCGIIPRKVYDTMIVEQVLYLGYKAGHISFSLHDIVLRRLGIELDKGYQKKISGTGLTTDEAVKYAAYDVRYLQDIMRSQTNEAKAKDCMEACRLENGFVPAIAYLEWCGIHLNPDKWKAKMDKDSRKRDEALAAINGFISTWGENGYVSDTGDITVGPKYFSNMTYTDPHGNLFTGEFDMTVHSTINWDSSSQTVPFLKTLGFTTTVSDKNTGEDKDSVLMKNLALQKNVCDGFLNAYMDYKKAGKVCDSYGQTYLNAINPVTNRIHSVFRQIGADTSRMSCGSSSINTSLAKLKGLPTKKTGNTSLTCSYPQLQNLPHDAETRACFDAEPGNLICSCDYSALESRLGADIYNEKAMLDEYLHGTGDMHSLTAKMIFPEELKGIEVKDIKKKRPDLRTKAKPVEFSQQFGGSAEAIRKAAGCTQEEAEKFEKAYAEGFKGIAAFKKKGEQEVKEKGYVLINPKTGHKSFWPEWGEWKTEQMKYTREFWEEYRQYHKGTGDAVAMEVHRHFKQASLWTRKALNSVTQGTGCIILKNAVTDFFNWIVDNNLFGVVKLSDLVHDEVVIEFPEEMKDTVPAKLKECMEKSSSKYCEKLPIPAEAEVGICWIH